MNHLKVNNSVTLLSSQYCITTTPLVSLELTVRSGLLWGCADKKGGPHLGLKLSCNDVHHDAPLLVMASGVGLAHLAPSSLCPPCTLCQNPASSPGPHVTAHDALLTVLGSLWICTPLSAWCPMMLPGPCLLGQTVVGGSWAPGQPYGSWEKCPLLSDTQTTSTGSSRNEP